MSPSVNDLAVNGGSPARASQPVTLTSTGIHASATVTGSLLHKLIAAASTNATVVKASAGRVYGYDLSNPSAAWKYVKFYNKATAPVVGTDVPVLVVGIPPNSRAYSDAVVPIAFTTGISIAIVAGAADADATAVAAADVISNIQYI